MVCAFVVLYARHNMTYRFTSQGIIPAKSLVSFKDTRSVTMNIFRKKKNFLFKSFVKVEISYVFIINMFSTAENCMEK